MGKVRTHFKNNANKDFRENLSSKFTYIKIESGSDVSNNPFYNHGIGVRGALENNEYNVIINGRLREDVALTMDIYIKFLRGELQ
ncbi:MAG: hypothetical protein WBD17_02965 [Candidatus Omnitrophota bacterium]